MSLKAFRKKLRCADSSSDASEILVKKKELKPVEVIDVDEQTDDESEEEPITEFNDEDSSEVISEILFRERQRESSAVKNQEESRQFAIQEDCVSVEDGLEIYQENTDDEFQPSSSMISSDFIVSGIEIGESVAISNLFQLNSQPDNVYQCCTCSYKTNLKGNLKRHMVIHSSVKMFKCPKCSYECHQRTGLQAHLLTHSDVRYFQCSECSYESKWKKDLQRHILIHTEIKKFKCPECDYKTHQKGNLKSHALTHSDEKLYKCFECNFECKRKANLKDHMLTHSEMKLFKCSACDYETNWKRDLQKHSLTHTNIKLFFCSQCKYGTNYKSDLNKHLLVHSKNGHIRSKFLKIENESDESSCTESTDPLTLSGDTHAEPMDRITQEDGDLHT